MPENRGNALAYAGARTHRPLPIASPDDARYRAAHQPQQKKSGGFDWDWNKVTCTGCQTKVTKTTVIDGRCAGCRGETTAPQTTLARLERSTSGEQVYEKYDEHALAERFEAPTIAPLDPEPETKPPADKADSEPARPEATDRAVTALLDQQLELATRAITRAANVDDPFVGLLRSSLFSTLTALDIYLERHQTPATPLDPHATAPRATPPSPTSLGLGGRRPAADREGEARRRPARRERSGPEKIQLPADQIVAAYRDGQTLAQIAATHNVSSPTIARCLDENGVPRRGAPVKHTPELVGQVRRLYTDEGLTKAEVAERLGYSAKVVEHVMAAHGIPARPAVARRPVDHSAGLKQRIAALGVSSRDIKAWALAQGLVLHIAVGLPSARLVDAYAAAHPTTPAAGEQSGDTA